MSETAPTPAPLAIPEKVMPNVEESQIRKNIKRKKYPYIVNVLKKFIGATIITKHILDLRINFTVSKLLTSALALEKQFTKAISKNKAV